MKCPEFEAKPRKSVSFMRSLLSPSRAAAAQKVPESWTFGARLPALQRWAIHSPTVNVRSWERQW